MATYEHLPLQRVEGELNRRKRGFGQASGREPKTHGAKIQSEVQEVLKVHRAKPKIADIDPALILKVETTGNIAEEDWARVGLTVLASEPGQALILFADDTELTAFQERVPESIAAEDDAMSIGVIDSGLTSAHPFLVGSLAVSFGEPERLGDSDEKGHGTPVSGIAVYGDIRQRLLALSADHPESAAACLNHDSDAIFNLLGYGVPDVARALDSEDNRVIMVADDVLPADKFAVYEVPIPEVFQNRGARQIRVALSFDPPVKHTRFDYAGMTMGFHLIRGADANEVFDAFRRWEADEGKEFRISETLKCDLKPGAQRRERGTLQCATFSMSANSRKYGDSYYLAVRCESGWSSEHQDFAVAVELRAQADIPLYQRLRERVRVRV